MIIYVTKETAKRYNLKMPEEATPPIKELVDSVIERQSGDRMYEWGAKLFYFDRRKCLQVVNFASKFTLFIVDVKVKNLAFLSGAIEDYMFDIYKDNPEMTRLLERYFKEDPYIVISALKDKSIIATLNHNQTDFAFDGYRLYEFIEDGVLQTKKFNRIFNTDWLLTEKVDGKSRYFFPAVAFERLLKERYSAPTELN